MPDYAYYPGCSLEHTARPYDQSVRAVFESLGIGLHEIDDWNCCGATMYMSIKKIVGYAVTARNLALAQDMGMDVCAPCSSCYTVMNKTNRHIAWNEKERAKINEALSAGGLSYDCLVKVRHPLDILVNDVGLMEIKTRVKVPLRGLKVAPYYGCQIVRPHGYFDDRDDPMTMDNLFSALGAETVPYSGKVRCCGAMLMTTDEKVALRLSMNLIEAAAESGADIIATACPLCQMNLEAYQDRINEMFGRSFNMPVVYFTHIVGLALGVKPSAMGMNNLIIDPAVLTDRAEEVTE